MGTPPPGSPVPLSTPSPRGGPLRPNFPQASGSSNWAPPRGHPPSNLVSSANMAGLGNSNFPSTMAAQQPSSPALYQPAGQPQFPPVSRPPMLSSNAMAPGMPRAASAPTALGYPPGQGLPPHLNPAPGPGLPPSANTPPGPNLPPGPGVPPRPGAPPGVGYAAPPAPGLNHNTQNSIYGVNNQFSSMGLQNQVRFNIFHHCSVLTRCKPVG